MADRTVGRERHLRGRNRLYYPRNLRDDGSFLGTGYSSQPIDVIGDVMSVE